MPRSGDRCAHSNSRFSTFAMSPRSSSAAESSRAANRSGTAPPSPKGESATTPPICSEALKKKNVRKNLSTGTFFLAESGGSDSPTDNVITEISTVVRLGNVLREAEAQESKIAAGVPSEWPWTADASGASERIADRAVLKPRANGCLR